MPTPLGAHSPRIAAVRALSKGKGRREQRRFAFEGPTLLDEARRCGMRIDELFLTSAALNSLPSARELESNGTAVFLVDERTAAKLSEVETPTGVVAVAPMPEAPLAELLGRPGVVLVLAGLNDPGNAGTLLRSADAFGAAGVIFGRGGVEPFHPKVVRAAMGSLFRVPVATAEPEEIRPLLGGRQVLGLAGDGEPLGGAPLPDGALLVVGHERAGLGAWEPLCTRRVAIPMRAGVESLNAAVAGSVALFEASRGGF